MLYIYIYNVWFTKVVPKVYGTFYNYCGTVIIRRTTETRLAKTRAERRISVIRSIESRSSLY